MHRSATGSVIIKVIRFEIYFCVFTRPAAQGAELTF